MITLVACGHTIGSVHSVDHPEIVSGPSEASNIAQFDTTADVFDNAPVTEYLSNTTTNPLVINKNDTLNSDKRIFASDGHATMMKLSNATVFKAQCENVFERMIDLVPANVTLTEPLQPVDVKPYIEKLELDGSGNVTFEGKIRIRITEGTGRDAADISVRLPYVDRTGVAVSEEIVTTPARFQGGTTSGYGETFQWYEFSSVLPAAGISAFDVKVASKNVTTTYDNAGTGGYPVSSEVFFQERNSCLVTGQVNGEYVGNITLVAAVHKDQVAADKGVTIKLAHRRVQPRNFIPKIEVVSYPLEHTSSMGDYYYYATTVPLDVGSWTTQFDIEAGNSTLEYQSTALLGNGKLCEA